MLEVLKMAEANVEKPTNSSSTIEDNEEEDEEEEYVVEKIVNHRFTKKGKLEYFLKWKGFTNADNTWEPAENLNCPELVEVYESERDKGKKDKKAGKTKAGRPAGENSEKGAKKRKSDDAAKEKKKADKNNGFEKGLTAEEIIGATENNGEVHFLIKWKEATHDYELIPSRVVNLKVPQMVIAFYEARLTWSTTSNSQDADGSEEPLKKNGVIEDEDIAEETPALNGNEEHVPGAIAVS